MRRREKTNSSDRFKSVESYRSSTCFSGGTVNYGTLPETLSQDLDEVPVHRRSLSSGRTVVKRRVISYDDDILQKETLPGPKCLGLGTPQMDVRPSHHRRVGNFLESPHDAYRPVSSSTMTFVGRGSPVFP